MRPISIRSNVIPVVVVVMALTFYFVITVTVLSLFVVDYHYYLLIQCYWAIAIVTNIVIIATFHMDIIRSAKRLLYPLLVIIVT